MTIFLSEADAARLGLAGAKQRRKASHARDARPDIPRAARAAAGEGERTRDLDRLARAGWVRTNYQDGWHWMTHKDGRTSPRAASYRAMLDTTLEAI